MSCLPSKLGAMEEDSEHSSGSMANPKEKATTVNAAGGTQGAPLPGRQSFPPEWTVPQA